MFRRRLLLCLAVAVAASLSACSQLAPTKVSVGQDEMAQRLQSHFPKRYPVAGLLQVEMQQPALQLMPTTNQMQTVVELQLTGKALPQTYKGYLDVRFGLRYEPQDRSVRAQKVEIQSFAIEGASATLTHMLNSYSARLASQALEDVAVYTVPDKDLKLADALGLQLGAITVTETGLEVAIEPKATAAAAR